MSVIMDKLIINQKYQFDRTVLPNSHQNIGNVNHLNHDIVQLY